MSDELTAMEVAELVRHYECAPFLGTDAGALVYRLARTVQEERLAYMGCDNMRAELLEQRDALTTAALAVLQALTGEYRACPACNWIGAHQKQCELAALRAALQQAGVPVDG